MVDCLIFGSLHQNETPTLNSIYLPIVKGRQCHLVDVYFYHVQRTRSDSCLIWCISKRYFSIYTGVVRWPIQFTGWYWKDKIRIKLLYLLSLSRFISTKFNYFHWIHWVQEHWNWYQARICRQNIIFLTFRWPLY